MMNAESVKARLKNFAKDTGHTFQEALTYYGLERTMEFPVILVFCLRIHRREDQIGIRT